MADRIYAAQEPDVEQADGDPHHWGMEFTVSADRDCVGGRAWVPTSGRPPTFFWQLWRVSDTTLIAQVDLNTLPVPTPDGWMSFTSANFQTPGNIALDNSEDYIVNVFFQGGDGVFTDPGSFPTGVGVVSSSTGRYNNGAPQNTMPATSYPAYFFADVEVDVAAASGTLEAAAPAATFTAAAEASAQAVLDANPPAPIFNGVGLVDADAAGTLTAVAPAAQASMTGQSASGGRTMGPCGWTIADPLCCETWDALDPAVQSAARDYAATILWAATGRRFGLCEVTVRPCGMKRCADGTADFYGYDWSGGTWVPYIFNGNWFNCACSGACSCDPRCQVRLQGPVDSIVEVVIGGIAVDPATYRVDDLHWLVRLNGGCWPTCADMNTDDGDNTFEVTYLRGDPVPPSLLTAAATLACEWGKACTNSGDCRLGNRVTSLARNGVTIDMVSPEDLLNSGMTGIFEVDQIIRAWNPYGLRERPRILAPELKPARQVTWP